MFDMLSRLPVIGFSAARAHRRLHAMQDEAQALLADPEARLFEGVPAVSGWSPPQHLFHVASINQSILRRVRQQCEGADAAGGGAPNLAGRAVLLAGRLPRGRAMTPDRFAPPERLERAKLAALLSANRETLHALEACLPQMSALAGRWEHPRLGDLDAREWLRFAQIHTRHHLRIVREIIRQK